MAKKSFHLGDAKYLQVKNRRRKRDKSQYARHFIAIPLNKFSEILFFFYILAWTPSRANAANKCVRLFQQTLKVVCALGILPSFRILSILANKIWNYLTAMSERRHCLRLSICWRLPLCWILFVLM